jgi:thiaminase/transcriptional activator TenA
MANDLDNFNDPNTLFGRLRSACAEEWDGYCNHEFVRRIGDATLSEQSFRHYLEQDYLFLIHFSRAWALAVYKADTLADMRAAASTLNAILNYEMNLHVRYCAGWALTEQEMERKNEARANMAYTRYVLERGLAGDVLDLHVALAPCIIGYAVIGKNLATDPRTKLAGNPYRDWIEMYAGEKFQNVAKAAMRHLDELAASRMGSGRFDSLVKTFRQATSLEIGFWDMGLNIQV